MKIIDSEKNEIYVSKNSGDPYGAGILRFATRWAEAMEIEMEGGKKLDEVASECEREADDEGITGFMYGCAVGYLSDVWEHGEKLRQWHNKSYGKQGDAANQSGGVINPAILTIG